MAQSNQSHQVYEEGDIGVATSAFGASRFSTLGSWDPESVENPLSTEGLFRDEGLATGRRRAVNVRAVARADLLLGPLTGDVYDLGIEDLRSVLLSWPIDIQGQSRLTDPFLQIHSPFITIPISRALMRHFASQRQKTMCEDPFKTFP